MGTFGLRLGWRPANYMYWDPVICASIFRFLQATPVCVTVKSKCNIFAPGSIKSDLYCSAWHHSNRHLLFQSSKSHQAIKPHSQQTLSKNFICDLERYFTTVVVLKNAAKSKLAAVSTTALARVWMLMLKRLSRASMCRQQPGLRAQMRSRLAAGFLCHADKKCSWRGTRLTWSKTVAEDARRQEWMNGIK